MDFCDVCSKPGSLVCGKCHDTVYCSAECQELDHVEHSEYCAHPTEMDFDELMEEVRLHLDHADEDHIRYNQEHLNVGNKLLREAAELPDGIEEKLEQWLIAAFFDATKRRFNRRRVRHQRRAVRRETRSSRRRGNRARRGTRQANALGREKKKLGRTQVRTQKAEQRETLAQSRNL